MEIINIIDKLITPVATLFGIWLGHKFTMKSQRLLLKDQNTLVLRKEKIELFEQLLQKITSIHERIINISGNSPESLIKELNREIYPKMFMLPNNLSDPIFEFMKKFRIAYSNSLEAMTGFDYENTKIECGKLLRILEEEMRKEYEKFEKKLK